MSLVQILQLAVALFGQLSGLVTQAITASTTSDQALLDSIHAQLLAMANTLRPPGTDTLT